MIEVRQLTRTYSAKNMSNGEKTFASVNSVSFSLAENSAYALVGESGSGKSTLAMMLAGILPPSTGEILLDKKNIWALSPKEFRLMRREIQLVLQNSQGALDPRRRIYESIAEPIHKLRHLTHQEEQYKVHDILHKVQLQDDILMRFPNELSGGQQSRVCIARAMVLAPRLVIFDESVSGLDVTIQKKVLDLLLDLRQEYQSTFLFITHDIDVALYMANHILVMKEGRIVESLDDAHGYDNFRHPYSRELIESLPPKTPYQRRRN